MKKFLSLVLALAMTLSLVTVSAGAKDFADSDELSGEQYEEAVNVMSEMGIIDGYAGGNFQPQGTLTRGAAAKIIACMMLGKTTAEALGTQAAPFKDVPVGSTFAGYIAYCVESGLIDGYADGTFRPQNTLTGFAFLKMLLTALGYDSAIEGYTGTNWTVNVAGRAQQVGLTDGNEDFVGSRAATREEACLYAVNALKATLVEYESKGTNVTVNGATVAIGASKATFVTSNIYNQATAISKDKDNASGDYTVEFAERYQPDLAKEADTDPFGRPSYTWTWKNKDIGTYVDYSLMVAEYTTKVKGGEVYSDVGSTAADYDLTYVQDGVEMSKNATKEQASYIAKKNDDTMGATGNGVLTQVFVDDDAEELTITEINTYLAETDDYNEKKETLKFNDIYGYAKDVEDVELDDFPAIADYVDGDMVLLTIADGEVQSIIDPETMEGVEIDEFSKQDYVEVEGTDYSYGKTATLTGSLGEDILDNYDNNNLDDKTFNIYLDTYGYLIGIEQVEDDVHYVFIAAYDRPESHLTNKTAEANAIFSDGTQAEIQVNVSKSTWNKAAVAGDQGYTWLKENGDEVENTWYSYTVKNDVYTLKYVANQFVDTAVSKIDSKHISQYDTADKQYYYGNADTNYITVNLAEVNDKAVIDDVESVGTGVKNVSIDVYDADEVKKEAETTSADSLGVYTVHETSGAYIIASIVVGDDGATSDKYAYMYGEPDNERYNRAEDVYYWTMSAVVDGVDTDITFQSDLPYDDDFAEGLYKVSYNHDGYAVDAVKAEHNKTGNDYQWVDEFDPNDTKIVMTTFGTATQPAADLTAEGDTLWITAQNIKRGFVLADECPAVIIEQDDDGDADKVVEYSTVEKAIKNLDNYDEAKDDKTGTVKNFDGTIIIFFDEGIATSVILTDTVVNEDHRNPGAAGDSAYDVADVDRVTRTIYLDKNDKPAGTTDKTEVYKAMQRALYEMGWEVTSPELITSGYSLWGVKAVDTSKSNPIELFWGVDWEK